MFNTVEDLANYAGIDLIDEQIMANLTLAVTAADAWMLGAIGNSVPDDDARAKQLHLMVAYDFYDTRGIDSRTASSIRRLKTDLEWQLRLEYGNSAQ